jgi:hypothetical protein
LNAGLISSGLFSATVLAAVLTCLIAPIGLRWTIKRYVKPGMRGQGNNGDSE